MITYIISLNEPVELINKIKENGLNPVYINGVNGKKLTTKEIADNTCTVFGLFGPKSAIGCAMSHLKTWNAFLETNDDYSVILEDTVEFDENLLSKIKTVIDNKPSDFDIIFLKKTTVNKFILPIIPHKKEIIVNDYFIKPSYFFGSFGYIISRAGAEKMVNSITNNISNHIDREMLVMYVKDKLNIFTVREDIINRKSDISTSSNSTSNFPVVLNKILSLIPWGDVKCDYVANFSIIRIFKYNITMINLLFLLLGIYLSHTKIDAIIISIVFVILIIPDMIYGRKKINIPVNYMLMILPILILRIKPSYV